MQALLSFEQSPPLAAPARFFYTAPVFGLMAGGLLLIEGADVFMSRWSPAALALAHLLTVGFLTQVMLGALIQVLPVVAGANIERPNRVATLVHAFLSSGTVFLAAGFWLSLPFLLHSGAVCLGLAVGLFLVAAGRSLRHVKSTSPTIRGIKLSLVGLAGLLWLGLFLVYGLAAGSRFSLPGLTDLHAVWGFAAWGGMLVMSMAYVVIPMFQLTPAYASRAAWRGTVWVLGLVLLWSLAFFLELSLLLGFAKLGLALSGLWFALWTLRLQSQRRRAKKDAHSAYWQLSMMSLIIACLMLLTAAGLPEVAAWAGWDFLLAVWLLPGVFISCIIGMLYKILPFLCWLHLQHEGRGKQAPHVNRLLPEVDAMRQFRCHCLMLLLCLLAVFVPDYLAQPAGLGVMLSMGWLGWNLWRVLQRYRLFSQEVTEKPEGA